MGASENTETVKSLYDAFGKGDVATILDNVTDDVDWSADTTSDAAPWYGQRTGKDELGKFFEEVADGLEISEFNPSSFAANDDEVLTVVGFRATVRATGKEIAMNLHHYWRFRDGKVERYRGSEDTAQMEAALQG